MSYVIGDISRVTTGLLGFLDEKINCLCDVIQNLTGVVEQAKGVGEKICYKV